MNLSFKRVLTVPGTLDPSTVYIVRRAETDLADLYLTNEDGTTLRHLLNKEDVEDMLAAYSAAGADKLTTPRNISITGDGTWTVLFDGSADATGAFTLANTGVVAGEHFAVTVDAKGRVTAGRNLAAADIPSIPGTKINSAISVDTTGNAATATTAGKLTTPRLINGEEFDGTADITISAVDTVTPRIAASEKGQADGVATLDNSGKVPASQLPSYVDDVIEVADEASLPETGTGGVIYVTLDTNQIFRWTGSQYISIPAGIGTADEALKLATPRTISVTGDATWQVTFDGSANVTAALTLANSGIAAGEYVVATFDAKGRATAGRALAVGDLPTGITSANVVSAASVTLVDSEW